ncbi:MAG: HEAT repeat domain-containing protein [Pyrinomonadaceae bacterium]
MTSVEQRLAEIELLKSGAAAGDVRTLLNLMGDSEWQTRRAAAAAAAEIIPSLADVAERDQSINYLLRAVSTPADALKRAAAIVALESLGRLALPHLAVAVKAATPSARTALAGVIGAAGGSGAVALLEPLSREVDQNVAAAAILGLGRTKSPEALPLLLAGLEGDDEWLRFAMIGALGELGDGRAVAKLAEMLNDPLLRESAIASLAEIGTIAAAEALGAQIANGEEINSDALSGLISIVAQSRNLPSAIGIALQQTAQSSIRSAASSSVLDALTELLPQGETGQINACLIALGWLGELRGLPLVGRLLQDCAYAQSAREVLIALACTEAGLAEIQALAPDRLPIVEAALALGEVRSVPALEASLNLLSAAEDDESKNACLAAIGNNANWLGDRRHVLAPEKRELLIRLLLKQISLSNSKPPIELVSTLGILAQWWGPGQIGAAAKRLFSGDEEAMVLARLAFLSECAGPSAANAAIQELRHPVARVRISAIELVARHHSNSAGFSLAPHLTDESAAVRRAAARAQRSLGGGSETARALVASLTDDDVWVRVEAIGTLAVIAGSNEAVAKRLSEELLSAHPLCRVAAIEAQHRLRQPNYSTLAALAQRDQHAEVRTAALRALSRDPRREMAATYFDCGLTDTDWAVRITAVEMTHVGDHRELSDRFAAVAEFDDVPAVRAQAIRVLADWSHPSAMRIAVAALDETTSLLTEAAFEVLVQIQQTRQAELAAHYLRCPPRAANLIHFILEMKAGEMPAEFDSAAATAVTSLPARI